LSLTALDIQSQSAACRKASQIPFFCCCILENKKGRSNRAMLRHIWEFIVAVLRSWGVLATGGFLVALIGLWEHLSARPIAGWPLWIAVALSLVSACFSAWRKERLTVEMLNAQIVPHQRRKEVRDHLSRLLRAKDEFVGWLNDPHQIPAMGNIDQSEEETRQYLRDNLSEADEILFVLTNSEKLKTD
jgi:hypothetical protein